MKARLCVLFLLSIRVVSAQPSIKGTWTSLRNKHYLITFYDSTWIDKHKDSTVGVHGYFVIGDTLFAFNTPGQKPVKYEIRKLTATRLLLYFPLLRDYLPFRRE